MHQTLDPHPSLLDALDRAVERYDHGTAAHDARVRGIALRIGRALEFAPLELEALSWTALLHDLGKLAVASAVLNKVGPLDEVERSSIRSHPLVGSEVLLALSPHLEPIASGVRAHHERWDGRGYPFGLVGDEIPMTGRIVAVADYFDALTSARPYRSSITDRDDAIALVRSGSGSHFEPRAVQAFAQLAADDAF